MAHHLIAPHRLDQLAPRHNLPAMQCQRAQQQEFATRDVNLCAIAKEAPAGDVEVKGAEAKVIRSRDPGVSEGYKSKYINA